MLTEAQKEKILTFDDAVSDAKIAKQIGANRKHVRAFRKEQATVGKRKRERFFKLAALAIPVLFFVLLEAGLQIGNYGGDLALFSPKEEIEGRLKINQNIGRRYFAATQTLPETSNDTFLKEKPQNGYRIFTLGGSSMFGYPYAHNGSMSKMLGQRLTDFFPEKSIEIVNLGMPAVNTFTLLDIIDEALEQQPDALIVYSGHNEFYGALGAGSTESLGQWRSFINFYIKMQRFKTMLLLRDGVEKLKGALASAVSDDQPDNTLMEQMVGDAAIPYESEKYLRGVQFFEANLREIVQKAADKNVRVILATLVSNLKDQKPFVSLYESDAQKAEFEQMIIRAGQLSLDGEHEQSLALYDSLKNINERPALLHFAYGRALENAGQFEQAKTAYRRARDLDGLRFRASGELNNLIHLVGAETNTPVAQIEDDLETASPNGLIGKNFMLEHLHPNVEGYFLMAKALAETMQKHRFIDKTWNVGATRPDSVYWVRRGVTLLDEEVAKIRIGVLMDSWPFKPRGAPQTFRYEPKNKLQEIALKMWKRDLTYEEAHVQMAEYYSAQKQFDKAVREYETLCLETPYNDSPFLRIGMLHVAQNKLEPAKAAFLSAIKIQPSATACKYVGSIWVQQQKPINGIPFLERALALDPTDAQARYNLTGAYLLVKNLDKAEKHLNALRKQEGDSQRVRGLAASLENIR